MKMEKDNEPILYNVQKARMINRRKYRLLGIEDEQLIKRLVDMDSMYYTYMWLHRKEFDEHIQKLLDELPDDF